MRSRGQSGQSHNSFVTQLLRWCFFVLAVVVLVASGARLASSNSFVPVGSQPDQVLISPDGSKLYVSNAGSDTVSVIDLTWWGSLRQYFGMGSQIAIAVGKRPGPMALLKDGSLLYVANAGGWEYEQGSNRTIESSVSVIDTGTNHVKAEIPVGGEIIDLAVKSDGSELYLTIGGDERGLKKVSLRGQMPVSWLSKTPCPIAVVFTPGDRRAYVNYQCGPPGHDPIMVYDAVRDAPKPLAIISSWPNGTPIANVGGPLAISPDGRQLWAAANDACARTDVYDNRGKGCPSNPHDKTPYIARGLINVIDTENNNLIEAVSIDGYDPQKPTRVLGAYRAVFAPDGKHVAIITAIGIQYLTVGSAVASGNRDLEQTYATSSRPSGLAFTNNGARAYLTLSEENRLEAIDIVPWTVPIAIVVALAAALTLIVLWYVSWRLQRRVRILFGQRWIFSLGKCNYEVQVTSAGVSRRLSDQQAASAVSAITVPANGWASDIQGLRSQLGELPNFESGTRVRIEADRNIFDRPWGAAIGDPWSKPNCTIAGQVLYLSPDIKLPDRRPIKRIVFRGLQCANDKVHPKLPWSGAEISEVTKVFRRWGAATSVGAGDATMSEFVDALEKSDVVHASMHASSQSVFLRDGEVKGDQLRSGSIRCSLLVLSACELANIRSDKAFLWAALNQGVNVLAATRRVDDYACSVFFSEFYSELLRYRRVGGISLATAIAAAAKSGRSRYMGAMSALNDPALVSNWESTIDSFVLFGDPSLSLELRRLRQ